VTTRENDALAAPLTAKTGDPTAKFSTGSDRRFDVTFLASPIVTRTDSVDRRPDISAEARPFRPNTDMYRYIRYSVSYGIFTVPMCSFSARTAPRVSQIVSLLLPKEPRRPICPDFLSKNTSSASNFYVPNITSIDNAEQVSLIRIALATSARAAKL